VERLHKLLFELSSAERINILLEFQNQRMKLSNISRKLSLTVTETSRHLQRLAEAKLVVKGADGLYGLTPYGEIALSLLSGLGYVTKHQDYFLEYDWSILPREFISRIGELEGGVFAKDIYGNLEFLASELGKASEFVWILSDQIVKSLVPMMVEKLKRPFDFRFISSEGVMLPDSVAPVPTTMRGVQKRVLSKVDMIVVVTDKAAGFCLPRRDGIMDYRNINGTNETFRNWCKDLFMYYWEKAKPAAIEQA
jgi:predicted transcriptional regulator